MYTEREKQLIFEAVNTVMRVLDYHLVDRELQARDHKWLFCDTTVAVSRVNMKRLKHDIMNCFRTVKGLKKNG